MRAALGLSAIWRRRALSWERLRGAFANVRLMFPIGDDNEQGTGLAFYAISGIWTRPSPDGPNYVRNFLSWTFAFLPGFAALFARYRRNPSLTS